MRNKLIIFLLIFSIPFSALVAKEVNLKVSVNYNDPARERLNVKFTSKGVSGTEQTQIDKSNFNAYSSLPDLTYQTTTGSNNGINLETTLSGDLFYAESKNDCFISWQSYTKGSACVYLSLDGPLTSTNKDIIHWEVYMDPATQNKQIAKSSVVGSKIKVVETIPSNFGVTGTRKFHVKTESLWNKPFVSYKANIVATIEAI